MEEFFCSTISKLTHIRTFYLELCSLKSLIPTTNESTCFIKHPDNKNPSHQETNLRRRLHPRNLFNLSSRMFSPPRDGGSFSVTFSVYTVVKHSQIPRTEVRAIWNQTTAIFSSIQEYWVEFVSTGSRMPLRAGTHTQPVQTKQELESVIGAWLCDLEDEGSGLRGCSPETSCASLYTSRWPRDALVVRVLEGRKCETVSDLKHVSTCSAAVSLLRADTFCHQSHWNEEQREVQRYPSLRRAFISITHTQHTH